MAQVVLENLCKSFPARASEQRATSLTNPTLAVPDTFPKEKTKNSVPVRGTGSVGSINILQHINLTIADGEFMVLVGPSGCGKSTLLRLIAGLETPTAGDIWVGDRRVNTLPPKARDIAMVFQSYALYPHMTVYNNLAFGLRRTGLKKEMVAQSVRHVAAMLELEPLLNRYPKQLSGGQKQRVALGRAMARSPQVFLMDEPLSNLDAKLRAQTRAQIVQLQRQLGTTTIYVTHDQTEAMTMGDRIAVLNAGEIQQIAAPLELYQRPANRFVAAFIGSPPMNFIDVVVKAPNRLHHPSFELELPEAWKQTLHPYVNQPVTLGIRPEHFSLALDKTPDLMVEVVLVEALGHETNLTCCIAGHNTQPYLQVRIDPQAKFNIGDRLGLSIHRHQVHVFEDQSGITLFPSAAVPTAEVE